MKGFEHVMVGDVRRGSSSRLVTVLAIALDNDRISWAKRIPMTPIDPEVIALRSAARRN
jgi:hypothetical protein